MAKKKPDKKIECFSAAFNDILICQHNDARPFIEAFVEDPENITQQNLGVLAGILEITDSSEDSSYIVNYLISVIKKEYYSRAKRGVIESFESALKKANLALAKLAEHENIAWIGHANAILLVIEKNNLHLSTSGSARALLLRGKTLTDLSDGGAAMEAPNPLKTFTDIVSGRLEEQDKLIITTDAMFELFSLEEIKRSALRFSSAEFLQFLKTALVNESERAAALVIEIKKEEKILPQTAAAKSSVNFNAFSQSAFSKKTPAKARPAGPLGISAETFSGNTEEALETNNTTVSSGERAALVNEIKEDLAKNNGDFVDKKTGHIYIKENPLRPAENSNLLETLGTWQDKLSAYASSSAEFLNTLKGKSRALKLPKTSPAENLPSADLTDEPEQTETERTIPEDAGSDESTFTQSAEAEEREKVKPEQFRSEENSAPERRERIYAETKIAKIQASVILFWQKNYPQLKSWAIQTFVQLLRLVQKISRLVWQQTRALGLKTQAYWDEIRKQRRLSTPAQPQAARNLPTETGKRNWMEKYSEKLSATSPTSLPSINVPRTEKANFEKILPKFSRLRNILAKMDYTQRIYAALAIVCLFIVPYFIAKIGTKPATKPTSSQNAPAVVLPLAQDKNVTRVEKIDSVYTGQNIANIINLNGSMYGVSATGVIDVKNNADYPFPAGFTPLQSVGMDDLNFVFILGQNNQILNWSPISKTFQTNSIVIPSGAQIASIGAYLTYLYILDSAHLQIYRYPRVTNGFGDATAWLKNAPDAAGAKAMAVSDNIYLAGDGGVVKFLQGKKQSFALENSATPIKADALYTQRDDQYLYILDKANSRLVKTDLNGQISAQYYNAEIGQATSFTVDEKNNLIYITTPTKVGMFGMN